VIGPALAGAALKVIGVAGCFFANAFSYIAVLAALLLVKFEHEGSSEHPKLKSKRPGMFLKDLRAGLAYVRRRPRIFWFLIITACTSLLGAPYLTMLPVFAHDVFNLGDTGLAVLMGVAGAGSVVGALLLAFLGDFQRKGVAVFAGTFIFSIFLVVFSLSTNLKVSLVSLFGMGFAIVIAIAVINTLLQQLVTDEMRGRVMSMFILSFIGAMPFGNLIAGVAAQAFGVQHTLAIMGVILFCILFILAIKNKRLWAVT
jgi:predicted MFS family arabinose efflux permease